MKKPLLHRLSHTRLITRRRVLHFLGGTATIAIAGCVRRDSTAAPTASTAPIASAATSASPSCVVRPQQTEGPYFSDTRLNRTDIRSDPSTGSVRPGVPLQLVFQVFRVETESASSMGTRACVPLSDAIVDVWHCDAEGVYSDVQDRSFDTTGQQFLRGFQTTNAEGIAQFQTIYPGWYPGRTVHIHFKIRTQSPAQQSYEFTSQLYFDDAATDQVHAQAPYASRGQRAQRNSQDGIFQRGGEQLIVQLMPTDSGYMARFDIGLEMRG